MQHYPSAWDVHIFATDITREILNKAKAAEYDEEHLYNVKYGVLQTYFEPHNTGFKVCPRIREMVAFSVHNLLDTHSMAPPESIFGEFDLIFCRNVLQYFHEDIQQIVVKKLLRSLAKGGVLIVGETEKLPETYHHEVMPMYAAWNLYKKRE